MATTTTRPPITESPWYWVYLFATAGLIALLLAGPKYAVRQAQIEKNQADRLRAAQLASGADATAQPIRDQSPAARVVLWPLYLVLGAILILAWVNLIRSRRAANRNAPTSPTSGEAVP